MQGKFEKNIEQRVSSFSLEPSPQIWLDVEAALHSGRNRRVIAWWWLSLLGLLLAGGGWWLLHNPAETKNSQQPSIVHAKKIIDSNVSAGKNKPILTTIEKQENKTKGKPVIKKIIDAGIAVIPVQNTTADNKPITQNKNRVLIEVAEQNKLTASSLPAIHKKELAVDTNNNKETSPGTLQMDITKTRNSAITVNEKLASAEKANDSGINIKPFENTIQKTAEKGKHQWLITIGGGVLQINQLNVFSASQSFYSNYSGPSANPGGAVGNSYQVPAAVNGYNLLAGVTYEHNISKRWNLITGLQYHYLQNKQSTGVDSLMGSGSIYFTIGTNATKTNYSHQLRLPLGLAYSINPSAKNNFRVLMGGSVTWVFAEKWLVTNANNTLYPYRYDASLNNRALLMLHAGIGYNRNNHFQISLLAEQGLTPIHKQTAQKYYWQQLSLQLSKPLQPSLRKHKLSKP